MNTDFDIDLSYFLSKVTQNTKLFLSTYSKKKGRMKNDLSNLRPVSKKKTVLTQLSGIYKVILWCLRFQYLLDGRIEYGSTESVEIW
jgi:hypothetical protein